MAKKPNSYEGAADAARGFADGHIDPAPAAFGAADPLEAVREEEKVALTEDVLAVAPSPSFILMICAKPGFRRGGITHPARAEYPLDAFTQEQLDAFSDEPVLTWVAMGGTPVARATRLFGADLPRAPLPRDPRLAGEAAAAAISDPPNRAAPGLRNAPAGWR